MSILASHDFPTLLFNDQNGSLSNFRDSPKIWWTFCTFHGLIHFHCALPGLHLWKFKFSHHFWYIWQQHHHSKPPGHVTCPPVDVPSSVRATTLKNGTLMVLCKDGLTFPHIVPVERSIMESLFGYTRMSGLWFHKVGYSYFWISFLSPQFFKNSFTEEFLLICRFFSFRHLSLHFFCSCDLYS